MYRKIGLFVLGLILGGVTAKAVAHEMTPTYPEFTPSHINGIYKTTINMFNTRKDVGYFEINVYDEEWYDIPYVSTAGILKLEYLKHASFDVYIRSEDLSRAVYICSTSMLTGAKNNQTLMASKICSKIVQ